MLHLVLLYLPASQIGAVCASSAALSDLVRRSGIWQTVALSHGNCLGASSLPPGCGAFRVNSWGEVARLQLGAPDWCTPMTQPIVLMPARCVGCKQAPHTAHVTCMAPSNAVVANACAAVLWNAWDLSVVLWVVCCAWFAPCVSVLLCCKCCALCAILVSVLCVHRCVGAIKWLILLKGDRASRQALAHTSERRFRERRPHPDSLVSVSTLPSQSAPGWTWTPGFAWSASAELGLCRCGGCHAALAKLTGHSNSLCCLSWVLTPTPHSFTLDAQSDSNTCGWEPLNPCRSWS